MEDKKQVWNKKITAEVEDKIIELLKSGKNITQTSKIIGVHPSTIWSHKETYPLFATKFTSARIAGVEILVDELQDVADNYSDPQKGRLKSDNLKFIIQHRDPANWSDKIQLDINQNIDIRGALDEAKNRIRDIIQIPSAQLVESTTTKLIGATGCQPDDQQKNAPTLVSIDDLLK